MIKNIVQASSFVTVSSYMPQVYGSGNMSGQMRYNTNSQSVEVYDGNNWISISQQASVGLSYEAEEAMRWAINKKREEAEIKELAEKHKAVAAALENLNKAQEQLKIVAHLSKDTDETTS